MDTILVVNAGSSSVKFQVFAVEGEGRIAAADQGPDGRDRQPSAIARQRRERRTAGRPGLSDRGSGGCAGRDVGCGRLAARTQCQSHRRRSSRRSWRAGLCTPCADRSCGCDTAGTLRFAGAAASAAQPRADQDAAGQFSVTAAGRVLRYRVPSRPRCARGPLRDPVPTPCRRHPALRFPRPVLRVHCQAPAAGRA